MLKDPPRLVVPATAMPLPAVTPMLLFWQHGVGHAVVGIDKPSEPPKATLPPPVSPLFAGVLMVTELFVNIALVTPAVAMEIVPLV